MSDLAVRGPSSDTELGQDYVAQIDLPTGVLDELVNWAVGEIEIAKRERSDLEAKIVEWERLYEARPKVKRKTFPWDGASNLVVPVIATAVDAVLARLMNSIFGAKDLWVGTARSPKWTESVEPIQNWLNWVGDEVMGMYKLCQRWFLSCIKFGTGVIKLPWERRRKMVVYKDAQGNMVNEEILLHDGPYPQTIPLADFFWSSDAMTAGDIQRCEWIAHRTFKTWKELKELEASGIYRDVDKIQTETRAQPTDLEQEIFENTGIAVTEFKDYELWEMWASYDVNNDGVPEEIVLTFQADARVVLRAVFNFYRHQERPIHLIRFMPRDNSILGIGLCQMLQDIQEEVTAIHNQRLDNATLANTITFKRRKGSMMGQTEVFPGGFLDVDNMDDLDTLDMGREHGTLLPEELHSNAIGEKRTGVSDYTVGRESAAIGSRATATSTLALIREGNKRFAMTIRDIRESLEDIAHQVIMLYQQFVPDSTVMYEIFSEKEKLIVQQYFALPPEFSRTNILIDTPALSEVENKEVTRQALMTLMGVLQGFYTGVFQAVAIAQSPQATPAMQQLAAQAANTASKIWEKLLESFDFREAEQFSPDIEALLGMAAGLEGMLGGGYGQTGPGAGPQGPGAPAGGGPQPPVAAPSPGVAQAVPAGAGTPSELGGGGPL